MTDMSWRLRGEIPFRPDGGIPQLEQICMGLLEDFLDTVDAPPSDSPRPTQAQPEVIGAEDQTLHSRSHMSLLLRDDEAAGIWVRFGSDYVVQGEVDKHTEPAVVEAILAAFRNHPAAGFRVSGSARSGRVRVVVVLEWPGSLLVRAKDGTHAELTELPARLPPGGSAVGVVIGELETGWIVDRARVLPVSAGRFCEALESAARRLEQLPPDQVRTVRVEGDDGDEGRASTPPVEDLREETVAALAEFGFGEVGADSGRHSAVEGEDDEADDALAVGGMSDGFGVTEEPRAPSARSSLAGIVTSPGASAPSGEIAVLPWDFWLDAVAEIPHSIPLAFDESVVPALLDLSEDDETEPPGRAVGGWLTPDGARVDWSPSHLLGDRSRIPTDILRVLSGMSGSGALAFFGFLAAVVIAFLVQPNSAPVRAAPPSAPIPTISFCSASNPAFVDAVHCWTDRILNGRGELERGICQPNEGQGGAEGRSSFCGLAHRTDGDGRRGDQADRVLAEACFQVLGEPEQYADPPSEERRTPRARVAAFLSDPRLKIQELAEVRETLLDDCGLCEEAARDRIRDRAMLTWLEPQLLAALPIGRSLTPELTQCTEAADLWKPRGAVSDWRSKELSYSSYHRARFSSPSSARPRSSKPAEARPPEWACYGHSEASRHRSLVRPAEPLAGSTRMLTPKNLQTGLPLSSLGAFGLRSQLGLHAALLGEFEATPSSRNAGRAAEGALACASLLREELDSLESVHPLAEGGDGSMGDLCGQVCAGYFDLIHTDEAWKTQEEDLALCVTGRVDPRAPERLCFDQTLAIPRTTFEEVKETSNGDGLPLPRWTQPRRRDARWSPGTARDWLLDARGTVQMDLNDPEVALDCGLVKRVQDELEWGAAFFERPKRSRARYEFDDEVGDGPSAATLGALPDPVLACSARLVTQESLGSAGLPTLLPEGSIASAYVRAVEDVAEELADESLVVQRSRTTCEQLGALCFTSAALMVKRPDLLWDYADVLASDETAEQLALAMGPDLERMYSQNCVAPNASREDIRTCEAVPDGASEQTQNRCHALCRSGARNYALAARNAVAGARLDAALGLAAATPVCSGLRDLWDDRGNADLSFESGCLSGLETQRARALALVNGGD